MKIKLWGVRGSLPTPIFPKTLESKILDLCDAFSKTKKTPRQFLASLPTHMRGGHGGNTTCVEIQTKKAKLIIDAGTGLRHTIKGYFEEGAGKGKAEVHLYFTHFHWDHIMGLPFFPPIYIPGNTIHLYAVEDIEYVLKALFKKPFFPVPYEALGAKIVYHKLEPRKPYLIEDLSITPYLLDHPDPCWGIRASHEGKVYSHCVDTEAIRTTREELGLDLPLYQDVDLMLFDAQYTIEEAIERRNWGHAAAPRGLEIALRENIKKIIFVHHDPMASDEDISNVAQQAVKYFESIGHNEWLTGERKSPVEWYIGQEGMILDL